MKKSVKITCIVAESCIVLGLLILLGVSVKFGFDYRNLNTTTAEVKTYAVEQTFENIDIHSLSNNVKFSVADGEQSKVVCTETARTACAVSVENGTLTVTQKDTRRWYEHFGIYWAFDDIHEMKIEVFLPVQEYRALTVTTRSGDIKIDTDEPFLFKIADLSANSGNIYFEDSRAERLTVSSTSGDIVCARCGSIASLKAESNSGNIELSRIVTAELSVNTTSGNIDIYEMYVDGNAVLESNSGNVNLIDTEAKSLAISTTSGEIQLTDADADELNMESNSGSIMGNLRTEKKFEVSTISGVLDVPYSRADAGRCIVKTTSGDVTLRTP